MKATLQRLLDLEAADSGIPEAEFKLGYLLAFVTSPRCHTAEAMQTEAQERIAVLEQRARRTA
jgi:hypothetical protein